MKIQVTENKSSGQLRPAHLGYAVRVYVNRDMTYGYFIDEHVLFGLLAPEQQAQYLAAPQDVALDVPVATAQAIIDKGVTPFAKPQLV